jgi:hypothetical protein
MKVHAPGRISVADSTMIAIQISSGSLSRGLNLCRDQQIRMKKMGALVPFQLGLRHFVSNRQLVLRRLAGSGDS